MKPENIRSTARLIAGAVVVLAFLLLFVAVVLHAITGAGTGG